MPRHHPLSLHRVLPLALVAMLGLLVYLGANGPKWWRRTYLPLQYRSEIAEAARAENLDPYLLAALINAESGFDAKTVSKRGAVGLMQIMPNTAKEVRRRANVRETVDADSLKDPKLNIKLGAAYLGYLMERYEDTATALAAYNAGSKHADEWKKQAAGEDFKQQVKFPATKRYIDKVMSERRAYQELYPEAFQ